MMTKIRCGILISGRGSNMEAIIKETLSKNLAIDICVVISNNPNAGGLLIAEKNNIKTVIIDHNTYHSRNESDTAIKDCLVKHHVELVILAGYMRLIGPELLKPFKNKILNIHPSLLPSYKGLDAQKQALDNGASESGCTVHFVDETLDGGPIILQKKVHILENDTVETLSQRILEQEHLAYPEAIRLYCEKKISIKGEANASTD